MPDNEDIQEDEDKDLVKPKSKKPSHDRVDPRLPGRTKERGERKEPKPFARGYMVDDQGRKYVESGDTEVVMISGVGYKTASLSAKERVILPLEIAEAYQGKGFAEITNLDPWEGYEEVDGIDLNKG